jgi:phage-related protein
MTEQIYWVDPDGGTLCLSDDNPYRVRMGVDGRFMPPFSYTSESIYGISGTVRRSTQLKERSTTYPLLVWGEDRDDVHVNLRKLLYATNPLRGQGRLQVITNDDKTFVLNCYLDSMPLPETAETIGINFQLLAATFVSHDVYWWDPVENDVFVDNVGGYDLRAPFSLYNAGDAEAWPIWTITGPMTYTSPTPALTLKNETIGEQMVISLSLAASNRLYIDTRPLIGTVLKNHNTDEMTTFSADSTPFSLVPGFNKISTSFVGDTSGTSVRARWVNRYLGV